MFTITLLTLVGCGELPTPLVGPTGNYTDLLGPEPDFSEAMSTFKVTLWQPDIELTGSFVDGPPLRLHRESAREGNCRLLAYTATSCDPGCGPLAACVDSVCEPYPRRVEGGTIDWSWNGGSASVAPGGTLSYDHLGWGASMGETSLRFDGIVVAAPTADQMDPDGDWDRSFSNRNGGDAVLRWSNPFEGARVRLHMTDCTGSHGGLAAFEIECEGPDTGELIVPSTFVDQLDLGNWSRGECGSHNFERYHASTPAGDPTIRLRSTARTPLFYRPEF